MKYYKIGGLVEELFRYVLGIIIMIVLAFIELITIDREDDLFIFLIIAFSISILILIFFLIRKIVILKRADFALKGRKGTGVVISNEFIYHRRSYFTLCKVQVKYRTNSGAYAVFITHVDSDNSKYLPKGIEIPIYINGEYAYFKEKEVYKDENLAEFYQDKKEKKEFCFCPYCGSKIDNSDICSNCKTKLN